MTFEKYKQYEENHASQDRFILIFGALHGRYMWNLYQKLDSSIAALCQYRTDAKREIDKDIRMLEGSVM